MTKDVETVADPVAVANRLRPVLLHLNRHLRREVHPLGVTGGQVSLLVAIKRSPGIGVRELAAQEAISPAGMSGHVDLVRSRRTAWLAARLRRLDPAALAALDAAIAPLEALLEADA
jgi:hypothetical protein